MKIALHSHNHHLFPSILSLSLFGFKHIFYLNIRIEKMMLFDAHCHLQDPRFQKNGEDATREMVAQGVAHGVVQLAVNGCHENDWADVQRLALDYREVIPSFNTLVWLAPVLALESDRQMGVNPPCLHHSSSGSCCKGAGVNQVRGAFWP